MTDPVSPLSLSLFRGVFGLYLAAHFFAQVPVAIQGAASFPDVFLWLSEPSLAKAFAIILGMMSLVLAAGRAPAILTVILLLGWVCLPASAPFIQNPGNFYVAGILLALAYVARKSGTKGLAHGAMPPWLYLSSWIVISAGYMLMGILKLQNPHWTNGTALSLMLESSHFRPGLLENVLKNIPPLFLTLQTWFIVALELSFSFFALWPLTRRWLWLILLCVNLVATLLGDSDIAACFLMMHLFTFDQRWVPGRKGLSPLTVFFDGVCNLCNATVDTLMREDTTKILRYAPLQGETAKLQLPHLDQSAPPASIVVTDGQTIFVESDAIIRIGTALGGVCRLLSIIKVLPRFIRDSCYRFIARNRYLFFGKHETCRVPTPEERSLFLP